MRFLVDNSLSPAVAAGLARAGHDAVHIRDVRSPDADDEEIFDLAAPADRIIVAEDTDFGTLLATRTAARPSVVLFRARRKSTEFVLLTLLTNLDAVAADLALGAVVVFEDARIRVRRLPIA